MELTMSNNAGFSLPSMTAAKSRQLVEPSQHSELYMKLAYTMAISEGVLVGRLDSAASNLQL